MKKLFLVFFLSFAAICGYAVGEYIVNNQFINVNTVKVTKTSINNYTTTEGEVKDGGKREIKMELPFSVKKLYVSKGDKVYKGQKLADIDFSRIITQLKLASIKATDKGTYENLINLAENKSSFISSPVNGIITSVNCIPGNEHGNDVPVFIITDLDNITVKVKISSEKMDELYIGQKAYIYQNDYMTEGRISEIFPASYETANDSLNMIAAEIVPLDGHSLICGIKTDVKIVNAPYENIILIPFDSILYDDTKPYVYVNSSGYALKKYITIGKEFEENAEIISGLSVNDKVITNPRKLNITEGKKLLEY